MSSLLFFLVNFILFYLRFSEGVVFLHTPSINSPIMPFHFPVFISCLPYWLSCTSWNLYFKFSRSAIFSIKSTMKPSDMYNLLIIISVSSLINTLILIFVYHIMENTKNNVMLSVVIILCVFIYNLILVVTQHLIG